MWDIMLCEELSISPTPLVRQALILWAASEGMPDWACNPLACTRAELGAVPVTGAGVQSYATLSDGIAATARELSLGQYAAVTGALRASQSLEVVWQAVNASRWRLGAQEGFYPLELWHAWQVLPDGDYVIGTEVDYE